MRTHDKVRTNLNTIRIYLNQKEDKTGPVLMIKIVSSLDGWWQWCWLHRYVGDKKDISDILRHVGDMTIGHQHTHILKCDAGDRFVILET